MRIGLVESVNARPLTWGIEKNPDIEVIYSSPKILSEMLVSGELDTALISSVECLRNKDQLEYSRACGVCAQDSVRSILFFKNKNETYPPSQVTVDSGSKTSVALLELLLFLENSIPISTIPKDPHHIQKDIQNGEGFHLLFGDNALSTKWNTDEFTVIDLANWWFTKTKTYFIFAVWAYPIQKPIPDSLFMDSLEQGLNSIEEIIEADNQKYSNRFDSSTLRDYLTKELRYIPEGLHWKGFREFERYLNQFGLL